MANLYQRKLAKIQNNLDKLASKGKDNISEYYKYIDELVDKGDFQAFQQCLYYYYKIDIDEVTNLAEIKRTTWEQICFETNTPFLKKLKLMYDKKKVYQTSVDIYSLNINNINLSLSEPLSTTFSVTSLTSSFILTKEEDYSVNMNIIRDNLYSFKLYLSDWIDENGTFVPSNPVEYQNILVGTFSEIQTQINLDLTKQWWIYTEERENILKNFTYSASFISSNPTASIIWNTDPDTTGYVLNVSTSSSFETKLSSYNSIKIGTSSSPPSYYISGNTASLTIFNLSPDTDYYYTSRYTLTTFANQVIIATSGNTASFVWFSNPSADAYSFDISTFSSFDSLLPGYSFTLGTVSNISPYITSVISNTYSITGLTAGTYYYRVRTLYGETQSGTVTSSKSFGTAYWSTINTGGPMSVNDEKGYEFELSKSSTFSSIEQKYKLPPQIYGTTASIELTNLSKSSTYYYRVNYYKGVNQILNYKVDTNRNTYLGQIIEREIFTPDTKYLLLNRQFAKIIGARKTYLEVHKVDSTSLTGFATASIFAYDDFSLGEDQNLLIRYTQAVDYINS